MNREEAIKKWIVPAIEKTWNDTKCKEIIKALDQEPCTVTEFADRCMECGKILGDMIKKRNGIAEAQEPCDAVSRKAAIDACLKGLNRKEMVANIKALPSVHPECTEDYCPAAFMPVECEDCISRQAVIEMAYDLSEIDGEHFPEPRMVVDVEDIQNAPSVTPAEKVGHWEQFGNSWEDKFKCSECGKEQPKILCGERIIGHWSDYCPNCGAKMQEVEDD